MTRTLAAAALLSVSALAAPAQAEKLEIHYAFEVLDEASGDVQRVGEDHAFQSGDRFRVVFFGKPETNVYLFSRGAKQNDYVVLYPKPDSSPGNPVPDTVRVTVPAEDQWMRMDKVAGEEMFLMVVSTVPLPALETAKPQLPRDAFERDLGRIEREHAPQSTKREKDPHWAIVKASGPKEMALVLKMSLRHE